MGNTRRLTLSGQENSNWAPRVEGNARPPHPHPERLDRVARGNRLKHKPGDRVGSWHLIEFAGGCWLCRCACGKLQWVETTNINGRKTTQCNSCARRQNARDRSAATRLGIKQSDYDRLANRAYAQRSRCRNPADKAYKHYGARGIKFKFLSIEEAVAYYITLPGWDDPDLEIDRRDNWRHYERGNLRFVNRQTNTSNTRRTGRIEYRGRCYSYTEFHRLYAPAYADTSTVRRKARAGLSAAEIIEQQANCRGSYIRHS